MVASVVSCSLLALLTSAAITGKEFEVLQQDCSSSCRGDMVKFDGSSGCG